MKKIALTILAIVFALGAIFIAGPTAPVSEVRQPLNLSTDLNEYLRTSEAQFDDIVPNTEKIIYWANPDQRATPLSIIYLHGYSATRQETVPLSDHLAAELGANLFYTRLAGHGRTGAALNEVSVNDWFNDAIEAIEIGKRIGNQVIVIGVSTGGTLAVWLAQQPEAQGTLHALILISPNFSPHRADAQLLTLPWANRFVPLLIGPERSWQPQNKLHAQFWTERYPSTALIPMMTMVKFIGQSNLNQVNAPTLVIYAPNDTVVDPAATLRAYNTLGSPIKQLVAIENSSDDSHHVLAGDILAPQDTEPVLEIIRAFLAELP